MLKHYINGNVGGCYTTLKNNKGYLFKEDAVGGFEGFEHSYPTLEEGLKIYNGFICYFKES